MMDEQDIVRFHWESFLKDFKLDIYEVAEILEVDTEQLFAAESDGVMVYEFVPMLEKFLRRSLDIYMHRVIYYDIQMAIEEWQYKERKIKPSFNAKKYFAKEFGITLNTFYNKLQGEKNGNKLSMDDFVKIVVSTEDLDLLDVLKSDIIQRIKIK